MNVDLIKSLITDGLTCYACKANLKFNITNLRLVNFHNGCNCQTIDYCSYTNLYSFDDCLDVTLNIFHNKHTSYNFRYLINRFKDDKCWLDTYTGSKQILNQIELTGFTSNNHLTTFNGEFILKKINKYLILR